MSIEEQLEKLEHICKQVIDGEISPSIYRRLAVNSVREYLSGEKSGFKEYPNYFQVGNNGKPLKWSKNTLGGLIDLKSLVDSVKEKLIELTNERGWAIDTFPSVSEENSHYRLITNLGLTVWVDMSPSLTALDNRLYYGIVTIELPKDLRTLDNLQNFAPRELSVRDVGILMSRLDILESKVEKEQTKLKVDGVIERFRQLYITEFINYPTDCDIIDLIPKVLERLTDYASKLVGLSVEDCLKEGFIYLTDHEIEFKFNKRSVNPLPLGRRI